MSDRQSADLYSDTGVVERPVSYRLKVRRAGTVVDIVLKPERMI
jgi:hypothetical protein